MLTKGILIIKHSKCNVYSLSGYHNVSDNEVRCISVTFAKGHVSNSTTGHYRIRWVYKDQSNSDFNPPVAHSSVKTVPTETCWKRDGSVAELKNSLYDVSCLSEYCSTHVKRLNRLWTKVQYSPVLVIVGDLNPPPPPFKSSSVQMLCYFDNLIDFYMMILYVFSLSLLLVNVPRQSVPTRPHKYI